MYRKLSRAKRVVGLVVVASIATPAISAPLVLYPVQIGPETARFHQGVPAVTLETANGAVQITPLPFDHGHVTFGVAIYNKSTQPGNFGIENISAGVGNNAVPVLTVEELEKRAKSRAMWSQIGVAMLAAGAAAAVANAHTTETSYGHLRTPHGTYSWASSYRDNSIGVLGATAAVAGGAAGIVGIQNRLDYTLEHLSNEIIQTTTIEPDASYGGRIVLEKVPDAKAPYDVKVSLIWNGTGYPFMFRVTKQSVSVPPPFAAPPALQLPTAAAASTTTASVAPAVGQVSPVPSPSTRSAPTPPPLSPREAGRQAALDQMAATSRSH